MAGLSITRRRKAWLKGVAYGASGKGKCLLRVPKLQDIFQRGILHGRTNVTTPYVKAIVEQEQRRRQPRASTGGRSAAGRSNGGRSHGMRRPR